MKPNIINTSKIFESNIRLQMIASLTVSDLTYPQLKKICQCTDGNMTTHTSKLLKEGYITQKKEFINNKPTTTYQLTDKGRAEFNEYIDILNELRKEQ